MRAINSLDCASHVSETTQKMPATYEESHLDVPLMALVFAVAGGLLTWTAAPGTLWLDTGEFGAIGWQLSISHPPGHPFHALLTRGVQSLLPIADLAFRSNLLSVLCVALALSLLYRIIRRVAPELPPPLVAALALIPLTFEPVYGQAIRAEVYGLQFLLSGFLALGCMRVAEGTDGRDLVCLSFIFGLAGTNHSFIGLYWVPFALFAMWHARVQGLAIFAAVVSGALGLLVYAYLPMRARAGGEIGWGTPDSMAGIWETISGKAWMHNLLPAAEPPGIVEATGLLSGYVIQGVGPAVSALAIVVLLVAVPHWVRSRNLLVIAVAAAAVMPFALRLRNHIDLSNPDLGGYLASGLMAIVVLLSMGLAIFTERLRLLGGVMICLVAVVQPGFTDRPQNVSSDRSSERYVRGLFAEVPVGGVLITSDYSSTFTAWSLRAFEAHRPDVGLVYRGRVHQSWTRDRLAQRNAELARRLNDFPTHFLGDEVRWERSSIRRARAASSTSPGDGLDPGYSPEFDGCKAG